MSPAQRHVAVDALRGLTVAAMLLVNTPGDWSHVYPPLLHAEWNGCTPTDLIFPMFLFVVGVSAALALLPRIEAGEDRSALLRAAAWRAVRIVALGLALHVLAWWWLDRPHFRPWGVLQRIGLCYAAVALCAIHLRPRGQWMLCIGVLAGYALVLAIGGMVRFETPGDRLDTALLGPLLYRYDDASGLGHDPEGLLSTVPAIATTLLGLRAGAWLRAGRMRALWALAVALLAFGAVLAQWQPMNKALWSPAYALWTGGWAMSALLVAHVVFERWRWPPLGHSFGINAIVAYAGSAVMVYALAATGVGDVVYRTVFVAPMPAGTDPRLSSLSFAIGFVLVWWAIVVVLRRMGVRVRL
jgi:predicted acyltransferase